MIDIGQLIYEELKKIAVPITPDMVDVPMIRLSDIKSWLDTLKMEVTGGSGQQVIEVEFLLDE